MMSKLIGKALHHHGTLCETTSETAPWCQTVNTLDFASLGKDTCCP